VARIHQQSQRTTNDPIKAHVIGFAMWVKAVEKAKSADADKVIDALPGIEVPNFTAGRSKMCPTTTLPSQSSWAR
jgi:urea transport system substrate-binding protein